MTYRLVFRSLTLALAVLALACGDSSGPKDNPTPGIAAISPASVEQGESELTITITGSDFVSSSVVQANGADRPTSYVSTTELRATLPASDLSSPGFVTILVVNPAPGGGSSNSGRITVTATVNPAPAISSLSPSFATAGTSDTDVTITGSGFTNASSVILGNNQKQTTFISATQLRISLTGTELAGAATLSFRVINPPPGGGLSNTVPFEVRSPVPAIASLGETQTTAGQSSYVIRVNGTGFLNNSVVRINGAPRTTDRVAPGALDATLLEGDLRAAATLAITVVNPAPGGGTSAAVGFTIVNGVPEITLLPSRGASSGRPGFSLYIHGRGFVPETVVRWNGSDRPTQYLSGERVTATISASDVLVPAAVQISVANPAPGGGAAAPVTLTVRQVGAPTSTDILVPIQGRDIAYESASARIYASIIGSAPTNGNSVVAVNPTSGTITAATFVGSEPGKLALSENGAVLYVGLNGASAVRRVNLPSLTPALQWSLSAGQVAGDLGVLPGTTTAVAVSRQRPGISPPLEGVTIYDDGIARPTSSPGHTGGNRIEFLESPSTLYGFNNSHTGFEFFTIGIDATGARHVSVTGGLIAGFYTDIVGAAGRIYGTDGSIVDAQRRSKVGSFGRGADALAVDPALGRAYLLTGGQLGVYDLNNFQLLGTVPVPTPTFDHPALVSTRLIRWGIDGVAFLDQTRLIIVRSPIIGQ